MSRKKEIASILLFGFCVIAAFAPIASEIVGNLDYYMPTFRRQTRFLLEKGDPETHAWYREHIRNTGTVYWSGPISQALWTQERPNEQFPSSLAQDQFRWQGLGAMLMAAGIVLVTDAAMTYCKKRQKTSL